MPSIAHRKPVQPSLGLQNDDGTALTFERGIVQMSTAKAMLGFSEDEVMAEIECGRIKWAWNLGTSQDRLWVCILLRSLICFRDPKLTQPENVDDICLSILPPRSLVVGFVLGTELQDAFNATSEHILNLLRMGFLKLHPSSPVVPWRSGPGGSPLITRESVVELLKTRHIL